MSKYQTPKIQFTRIATSKYRIPKLKIPRMCQNPWLGLIIRLRIPLNEPAKNQTTWINLSLERPLISCLSKRSYNPSLKSLLPADFFREVTHVKHFLFQSSRWSTEQEHKRWLWVYFSASPHLPYCLSWCTLISNQNLLGSTCNISNNLQREETLLLRGREKGKSRKS